MYLIQVMQVMLVMKVMQVSQVMQASLAHLWVDFRVLSFWYEFLSYFYEQHSSDYHYDYVYDVDNGHCDDLPMKHRFLLRFNKQNYKILTDLIYFQISSKP